MNEINHGTGVPGSAAQPSLMGRKQSSHPRLQSPVRLLVVCWGIRIRDGGEDCPRDECTWEPHDAPLDAEELLGETLELKCGSSWFKGKVADNISGEFDMLPCLLTRL